MSLLVSNMLMACSLMSTNKEATDDSQVTKNSEDNSEDVAEEAAQQPEKNKPVTKKEKQEVAAAPEMKLKSKSGIKELPVTIKKGKHKGFTYRFLIREIPDRKVAAVNPKAGMQTLESTCEMKTKPTNKSKSAGLLKKGKKVWTEPHNKKWSKIFRKQGPAYIQSVCL